MVTEPRGKEVSQGVGLKGKGINKGRGGRPGAGGGLLLAANMTLLLTERPGASLVVGPCYANVQEGSQAMQNGSYAIGLSEIYAIDFEAARRLEAQEQEAAAIEAAFLEAEPSRRRWGRPARLRLQVVPMSRRTLATTRR